MGDLFVSNSFEIFSMNIDFSLSFSLTFFFFFCTLNLRLMLCCAFRFPHEDSHGNVVHLVVLFRLVSFSYPFYYDLENYLVENYIICSSQLNESHVLTIV